MTDSDWVEAVAERFHDEYEARAATYNWLTQERSRVPWDQVPEENKALMRATVAAVFEEVDGRILPTGSLVGGLASYEFEGARKLYTVRAEGSHD